MQFSFDHAKQAANVAKHGLMFSVVERFQWETASIEVDSRKQYSEPRLVAVGLIESRLHVVVFSLRDTTVRLISVRRANKREVNRYADCN